MPHCALNYTYSNRLSSMLCYSYIDTRLHILSNYNTLSTSTILPLQTEYSSTYVSPLGDRIVNNCISSATLQKRYFHDLSGKEVVLITYTFPWLLSQVISYTIDWCMVLTRRLLWTRGPPESPPQVPTPPLPLVQRVDAMTLLLPYTAWHTAFVITCSHTKCLAWLVLMPDAVNKFTSNNLGWSHTLTT